MRKLAWVVLPLVGFVFSCKPPKAGDKCVAGQVACADPASALTCADGKYKAIACRGPKGCSKSGAQIDCDDSVAQENDGCDEEDEVACSVDKKAALGCHGGKFVVDETCKGAKACELKDDKIYCDNDIADPGDPCHFNDDYGCTSDKTFVVKCVDHKMAKLNSCRGAKGCRVFELPQEKKTEFVCDDSIAQADDECDESGEHACAMDKKSLYVCKSGKFSLAKACAGPKGCSFDEKGEKFDCDSTGSAGKPIDVTKPVASGMVHKPATSAAPKGSH